jgi:2-polyprenyl-3-methyl-5-hydroxy-6-metoxy-1,4-benzoquinol methylase
LRYFLPKLRPEAKILDIGCGDSWFGRAAAQRGYPHVTGIDLYPPADVVGDVKSWSVLGLEPHSFDAIVAFEVVEHGDFSEAMHELLKPSGLLMLTTPIPFMDPVCRLLESVRLLQRRTSPHTHLIDLRKFPRFTVSERQTRAGVSQWAVLKPNPGTDAS